MRPIEHMPVILILIIYLPAAFFGIYVFGDSYAWSFLAMLGLFVGVYYGLFLKLSGWLKPSQSMRQHLWCIGDKVNWMFLAYLAAALYVCTLLIAGMTVELTPLGAALRGGDWIDIARARADFMANREGGEALLRYSSVIFGRAVMPFIVIYAYWFRLKFRHLLLVGVLLCYLVSLEKASALFLFIPLIILSFQRKVWSCLAFQFVGVIILLVGWTFLAHGGLYRPTNSIAEINKNVVEKAILPESAKSRGDPRRFDFYQLIYSRKNFYSVSNEQRGKIPCAKNVLLCKVEVILNRSLWIPYITAYDWLKLHDEVLGGKLNYGRSIGVIAMMLGETKLDLEGMVYEYEFGTPPGGAGKSNTIFLVDAKLAFGWFGVLLFSLFATFCSMLIVSSKNDIAKIASVSSFITLSVSSLTATLLSGGMFFYILICLLTRPTSHK